MEVPSASCAPYSKMLLLFVLLRALFGRVLGVMPMTRGQTGNISVHRISEHI